MGSGDFPGGLVTKKYTSNAGDMGSVPGGGPKIPPAARQLNPRAATTEWVCSPAQAPQLERRPHHTKKDLACCN